jgi:ribosomal protein S18 acetylase RimI-like enzyme
MEISIHEVRIVKAGPERIGDVEPLWKALYIHHQNIVSDLPFRPLDQSWTRNRLRYEQWLSEIGSFMLFAEYRDKPVGYAIVHLQEGNMMWQTPDKIASLEMLSVLPEARNMGIGTALMNAVYEELRLSNIAALVLNVICTNTDALRFYERCGLIPRWINMYQSIPQKQATEQ